MMLFNMINLAQFERRQISERVTLNFHSRALRGLRNGGAPTLGFMVDATNKAVLQINEEEVDYVKTIFNLYLQSGSLYQTAAKLRELRIPCRARHSKNGGESGGLWNVQTTANLLRNYHYAGLREVNKGNKAAPQDDLKPHEKYQVVKAAWPALIDEATFFAVQKMMDENFKLERVRLADRSRRAFLVTGIIECPDCGRALVGSTARGRSTEVRYYIHRPIEGKPVTCSIKYFRADTIEDVVINHLLNVVSREGYLVGIEQTLAEIYASKADSIHSLNRDLEGRVAQADNDIKKLIRLQIQTDDEQLREIYSSQLKEMKDRRTLDATQLENVKQALESVVSPSNMMKAVTANVATFQKAWAKAPTALQKKLLRSVIERLVPREDCIEVYYHSDQGGVPTVQNEGIAESTGVTPVDLAAVRSARKTKTPAGPRLGHDAKIFGSYVLKSGCGGWI
jgi:site-specific DNA recombinase